jgi:hypothetical protein
MIGEPVPAVQSPRSSPFVLLLPRFPRKLMKPVHAHSYSAAQVAWLGIVSIGLKGDQFHRFGGSHSDEKVGLGHTNVPAGRTGGPPPHSKPDKFRPDINPSNYPPAHPTGEAMLKHGARGGDRGSIPWLDRSR